MPSPSPSASPLLELWGDTVQTRHLAAAIAIGAAVSLSAFAIASQVLAEYVRTPELARAYAMLAGLAGCVVAGVLCARLFPPKRVVSEDADAQAAASAREQALDRLAEELGGLGRVADLPPAVVQELRDLQLYELFAAREGKDAAMEQRDGVPADARTHAA